MINKKSRKGGKLVMKKQEKITTYKLNKENFQNAIKNAQTTQKILADKLGLTETMISYYANGARCLKKPTLERISQILDVSIPYLLGESNYPEGGLSAFLKDENDSIYDRYQETFDFLHSLGIRYRINDERNIYISMDGYENIYIDHPAFWFLLNMIQSNARNIFKNYCESALSITGARGLSDIDPLWLDNAKGLPTE